MSERVKRELILPASREEVWDTITGPGWLAAEVDLELRPGGEARFAGPEGARSGWVEEAVAPARLIFWWAEEEDESERETARNASRVELVLDSLRDGTTRLRVVETRPLELLDLVGIPLSGNAGARFGPALVAA